MAKIVKIPLVMKNGEKATDMKSLKENFDTESVVGYFLDGKLAKWLNDRYYEDEAEAVAQLSKEDSQLAGKLCAIFGIEYEEADAIDAEEIARRKERIARLKQLTDNEDALQNIDAVAFDQEELAELYDRGIEKIYLCEGEFKIPKSKQGLEYVLVGDASATGLPAKKTNTIENMDPTPFYEDSVSTAQIPEDIADKIATNPYVRLNNYIVYYKNDGLLGRIFSTILSGGPNEGFFKVWNKLTREESSFSIPEYDSISAAAGTGNQLLLHARSKDGLLLYDVDRKKQEIICTDYSDRSGFSLSGQAVAYTDSDHRLLVYNITSKKKQVIAELGYTPSAHKFVLCGNKLLYHNTEDDAFCCFDIESKQHDTLFDMDSHLIQQIVTYDELVYLFMYNVYSDYVALWSIDLNRLGDKPIEHFRFSVENSFGLEELTQIAPYFIYVKPEHQFPVYSFNMNTKELTQVASECGHTYREEGGIFKKSSTTYFVNSFQVVGDYLYFDRDDGKEFCRINLLPTNY